MHQDTTQTHPAHNMTALIILQLALSVIFIILSIYIGRKILETVKENIKIQQQINELRRELAKDELECFQLMQKLRELRNNNNH